MLKPTSDRDAAFNVTKQIPGLSRETFRTVGEETPRNLPTSKRHKTFGARQNFFGPVLANKSIPRFMLTVQMCCTCVSARLLQAPGGLLIVLLGHQSAFLSVHFGSAIA